MMYENSFVREVKEKNIENPSDILNWYRNLYYKEGNNTEHGIVANAINDLFISHNKEKTRLQSEINRLNKYDEERDIALHARLISEAKQQAFNEIFEELDVCLARTHSIQMNENAECYEYYEGYIKELIEELKSKHKLELSKK